VTHIYGVNFNAFYIFQDQITNIVQNCILNIKNLFYPNSIFSYRKFIFYKLSYLTIEFVVKFSFFLQSLANIILFLNIFLLFKFPDDEVKNFIDFEFSNQSIRTIVELICFALLLSKHNRNSVMLFLKFSFL
jgi:hypothetical protein